MGENFHRESRLGSPSKIYAVAKIEHRTRGSKTVIKVLGAGRSAVDLKNSKKNSSAQLSVNNEK